MNTSSCGKLKLHSLASINIEVEVKISVTGSISSGFLSTSSISSTSVGVRTT
jgi:hypothetical protein